MKLVENLKGIGEINKLEDDVRNQFVQVFDYVLDLLPEGEQGGEMIGARNAKTSMLNFLNNWVRKNPGTPARLLTISYWSESQDTDETPDGYLNDRVIKILENQFGDSFRLARYSPEHLVVFLNGERDKDNLDNDFDWISQIEALNVELESIENLGFDLESVKWQEDASTVQGLLDLATPSNYSIQTSFSQSLRQSTLLLREIIEGEKKLKFQFLTDDLTGRFRRIRPFN